jgi:hypothetical protein
MLAVEHWQTRSLAPQVVAEATAFAIQVVAQSGMAACPRPARARRTMAEYEYCILIIGRLTLLP